MNFLKNIKEIVYLGPEGTYSQIAANGIVQKYGLSGIPCTFRTSIKSIIDYADVNEDILAVVPIENSIEGIVRETIDNLTLVKNKKLKICAEYVIPIDHCLLAKKNIPKNEIKTILSHTQPLAQCRNYIYKNLNSDINIIETNSSAAAAKSLLTSADDCAAIANSLAAKLYGLCILDDKINDNNDNRTRFVVLSKYPTQPTNNDKTSIVFSTVNTAGALCNVLNIFKKYNINLSYIDSRPSRKNLKEYNFYIDFDGHIENETVKIAISEIFEYTTFFRHNGSYQKDDTL